MQKKKGKGRTAEKKGREEMIDLERPGVKSSSSKLYVMPPTIFYRFVGFW